MLAALIKKSNVLRKLIFYTANPRAKVLINRINPYLEKNDRILDIGSDLCNISHILNQRGFRITPLDVADYSFIPAVTPDLYDGNRMPYIDNEYDCSLLITVLHHTPDPVNLINEAIRVTSKKFIIIEDIYQNRLHQLITYFVDSLLNLEFRHHPHSNKNDQEWKDLFQQSGLTLVETRYQYSFLVMKQATYYLEK